MRLLSVAGIVAGGIIGIGSAARATQGRELPAAVRAQLSATYPGWRFAKLHPEVHKEFDGEPGERTSAAWVAGDYNGDRRTDYAVQIVRPGPADSTQLVLVFIAGRNSYQRFLLQAGGEHLGIYLRTARRGEHVLDLDKDANGDSSFVLSNDAVDIIFKGEAGITCLYEAGRWRCVISGD
jgi:hypothetical protein